MFCTIIVQVVIYSLWNFKALGSISYFFIDFWIWSKRMNSNQSFGAISMPYHHRSVVQQVTKYSAIAEYFQRNVSIAMNLSCWRGLHQLLRAIGSVAGATNGSWSPWFSEMKLNFVRKTKKQKETTTNDTLLTQNLGGSEKNQTGNSVDRRRLRSAIFTPMLSQYYDHNIVNNYIINRYFFICDF